MCGIVGYVNFRENIKNREELLKKMVSTLKKRRS
jgi:asparagine synthetase B (glutamine-hydrolysing)